MTNKEFFTHISTYFRSESKAEKWCDDNGCDLASVNVVSLQNYKDVVKVIIEINRKNFI